MRGQAGAAREWLEDEAAAAARLRLVSPDEAPAPSPVPAPAPTPALRPVASVTPLRNDSVIYAW